MHEPSDTIVAGALARLRAEDERLGGDADAALNSLTWDEGLQTITQYGLQRFPRMSAEPTAAAPRARRKPIFGRSCGRRPTDGPGAIGICGTA